MLMVLALAIGKVKEVKHWAFGQGRGRCTTFVSTRGGKWRSTANAKVGLLSFGGYWFKYQSKVWVFFTKICPRSTQSGPGLDQRLNKNRTLNRGSTEFNRSGLSRSSVWSGLVLDRTMHSPKIRLVVLKKTELKFLVPEIFVLVSIHNFFGLKIYFDSGTQTMNTTTSDGSRRGKGGKTLGV